MEALKKQSRQLEAEAAAFLAMAQGKRRKGTLDFQEAAFAYV
jgi:hypothetical protein